MTDFMLGVYCSLTILGLLVFSVIRCHEGRRMSGMEGVLSLTAILCWPLLGLAVALAIGVQKLRRRK